MTIQIQSRIILSTAAISNPQFKSLNIYDQHFRKIQIPSKKSSSQIQSRIPEVKSTCKRGTRT